MRELVIVDTSCLILFSKLDALTILRSLFNKVSITSEIAEEFGGPLPSWISLHPVSDKSLQRTLEQILGKGEASAIALAFEEPQCTLVIDDRKARRISKSMGFKVTGTLGIIVKAKQMRLIPEVKPFLNKLPETDFRVSDTVIAKILEIAGEK